MKNKLTFTHDEKEYAVERPSASDETLAQMEYNKAFKDAVDSNAFLRKALTDVLRKQGLWTDEKEKERKELLEALKEKEFKLHKGGIKLKEARELAISMAKDRNELNSLMIDIIEMDALTAEGQAENRRFQFLLTRCFKDGVTGKRVYNSVEEYLDSSDSELADLASENFSRLRYDLDDDYVKKLPENKFLVKYGFMNEDLKLVNENNHLVDDEGRLINEDGRFVNEEGQLVDIHGNLVDADGNWVGETSPFLDDDGNPL